MRVFESQHFVFPAVQFYIVHELVQETGSKMESEHIYRLLFTAAVIGRQLHALRAAFLFTITVAGGAVTQFEVVFFRFAGVVMVNQHAGILSHPWVLGIITPDIVLDGTRYLLSFFVQQVHAGLYSTTVRYFQYVHHL
jgi:hypothetical protein